MTVIAKKPIQWLQVKDLHECTPLADDDLECMKDVRAALAKHGSLDQFAHLVHEHFAIPDDQILVEYSKAHTHEQYEKLAWCRPQFRSIGNTHETRSPPNFWRWVVQSFLNSYQRSGSDASESTYCVNPCPVEGADFA